MVTRLQPSRRKMAVLPLSGFSIFFLAPVILCILLFFSLPPRLFFSLQHTRSIFPSCRRRQQYSTKDFQNQFSGYPLLIRNTKSDYIPIEVVRILNVGQSDRNLSTNTPLQLVSISNLINYLTLRSMQLKSRHKGKLETETLLESRAVNSGGIFSYF